MSARILVIEDNPESLDLMSYLLTAFGQTVAKATDGEEGLKLVQCEKFDLVLCDVQLPKVDGYEIARQIRRDPQLRELPLVAVTAYAMPDDREKILAAGFSGYVTKPIVPEDFVGQMQRFLQPGHTG
jgi:CheY-like chemotaxis protein